MTWRRPGGKPLSEPMMVSLLTHIRVTRPQWAKPKSHKIPNVHNILLNCLIGVKFVQNTAVSLQNFRAVVCNCEINYLQTKFREFCVSDDFWRDILYWEWHQIAGIYIYIYIYMQWTPCEICLWWYCLLLWFPVLNRHMWTIYQNFRAVVCNCEINYLQTKFREFCVSDDFWRDILYWEWHQIAGIYIYIYIYAMNPMWNLPVVILSFAVVSRSQ